MPRLVIIHGPPNTGKLAAMWAIASADSDLRLLHRDTFRVQFGRLLSEVDLTRVMCVTATALLKLGYGVVTCGQNQTGWDAEMWESVAMQSSSTIEWASGLA